MLIGSFLGRLRTPAGLTRRLLLVCLGLYVLIAVLVTLVEVTYVSTQAQSDSDRQIRSLAATFGPSLTLALWNYNVDQIDILLKAMAEVPAVGRIQLTTTEGTVYTRPVVPPTPLVLDSLGPPLVVPLARVTPTRSENLGSLSIEPSLAVAKNQIATTIWLGLFRTSIVVTLLSVVLVVAAGSLVGRPLRNLARQIRELDPGSGGVLVPDPRAGSELAQVADAFNALLEELRGTIAILREREREILILNSSLESKVDARTADLDERNRELERTVVELESTRGRLMESAKMAVLGQLVAGVAHELNTPLGAAQSASHSALEILEQMRQEMLGDLGRKRGGDTDLMERLFLRADMTGMTPTSRDLRTMLRRELQGAGVPNLAQVLDTVVDLGITPPLGNLAPLLAKPSTAEDLATVQRFVSLSRACHILDLASGKMAHVVDDLLGYARKEDSAALLAVDLANELETILRLFAASTKGGIRVVREFETVPALVCKRDKLQQVWINLVSNAIQAMGGKGTLTLGLSVQGKGAEVRVEDTGAGISPDVAANLFTPFFTTKPQGAGTGLGLTICLRIIEEHGGKIAFESAPGRTVFRVWLPVAAPGSSS
ncbi:MAG TPA: ATP-binding protein [Spirochaetia bacterium]|nr:ATP-binding protein [Spirochaetia bacterium]